MGASAGFLGLTPLLCFLVAGDGAEDAEVPGGPGRAELPVLQGGGELAQVCPRPRGCPRPRVVFTSPLLSSWLTAPLPRLALAQRPSSVSADGGPLLSWRCLRGRTYGRACVTTGGGKCSRGARAGLGGSRWVPVSGAEGAWEDVLAGGWAAGPGGGQTAGPGEACGRVPVSSRKPSKVSKQRSDI